MSVSLAALRVGDPPELWEGLGFAVIDGVCWLGGVAVELGGSGAGGIAGWAVEGLSSSEVDGLPGFAAGASAARSQPHPNGAIAIDHVVVVSGDFDRTAGALEAAGMPLRRVREVPGRDGRPGFRQGFRRLGPAILELVETPAADPGPARFWGLVVVVSDIDALAERLGELLSPVRDAVQPGRRIATLQREAGLGQAVAFMSPE